MFDHLMLAVADMQKSVTFYDKALAPLGISRSPSGPAKSLTTASCGLSGKQSFFLHLGDPVRGQVHIAFSASSRKQVDAFYEAALSAGGRDNGAPGIRKYHPGYYAAFILDPDGCNVEVVCHQG